MARLNQQDAQMIREIVTETYRMMMEQEAREIAKVHREMLEAAAMIETIAEQDELDISTLGEEAEKRAYALAVAMAEQAVVYAENDLIEIKKFISEAQIAIAKGGAIRNNIWKTLNEWENIEQRLLKQEEAATIRLEAERKRLSNLKLESRGLKLLVNDATS